MTAPPDPANYTPARPVTAEGARIAFVSCLRCGSALVLDPGDPVNVLVLHESWHRMTR